MLRRAFFLLLPALFFAQSAEVEITAEPHHHLIFANHQVRVFSVEVAPHSATLMHRHLHDYIYVTLGAADISNEVSGKPAAELKLADGETRFSPGPFAHLVRDLAEQPFRNVTVELLEDEKLRHSPAHWDEDRGLDILQGGTKEILFVKDGVCASEFELQVGGVLPPMRHPYLLIAVSDVALMPSEQVHGGIPSYVPREAQLKSGDSRWHAAADIHGMTNVGRSPAKFVTLEFP
jgi:quercetin dioxygenase-like cupin family protein